MTQKFEERPNFFYLIAEILCRSFFNANKSKKKTNDIVLSSNFSYQLKSMKMRATTEKKWKP